MSRSGFRTSIIAGALAVLSLPCAQAKPKPNVVLIVCDDLNDYITGMGGHPQARTPNVEKLARSGVAFKRAYSNNPVCAPSRSSFLTGMFPLESLAMPLIRPGDVEDCHYADVLNPEQKGLRYFRLLKKSYADIESGLKAFTQAYLACVTAVDECIGRVIDAVDNSSFKDNTIIVVTSDHGWQMGQKDHDNDPREWTNLAGSPEHVAIRESLRKKMLKMRD